MTDKDFTDQQLKSIADHLRAADFWIDDMSNDDLAQFALAILKALGISVKSIKNKRKET